MFMQQKANRCFHHAVFHHIYKFKNSKNFDIEQRFSKIFKLLISKVIRLDNDFELLVCASWTKCRLYNIKRHYTIIQLFKRKYKN